MLRRKSYSIYNFGSESRSTKFNCRWKTKWETEDEDGRTYPRCSDEEDEDGMTALQEKRKTLVIDNPDENLR